MMKVKLYAYTEPRPQSPYYGSVRYIGRSVDPGKELGRRLTSRGPRTPVEKWCRALAKGGFRPGFRVLDVASDSEWSELERRWVAYARSLGLPLLNLSEGGRGNNGEHVAAASRRRWQDPGYRARLVECIRSRATSPKGKENARRAAIAGRAARDAYFAFRSLFTERGSLYWSTLAEGYGHRSGALFEYGYADPRSGRLRFVGVCANPGLWLAKRLQRWRTLSEPLGGWFRQLVSEGSKPSLVVFGVVRPSDARRVERNLVRSHLARGEPLLNGNPDRCAYKDNPEISRRRLDAHWRPEAVERRRRQMRKINAEMTAGFLKRRWSNPENRRRQSELIRAKWTDPDRRIRAREKAMLRWSGPESRKRQSELSKAKWTDPGRHERARERAVRYWSNPENRRRRSELFRAKWADPDWREAAIRARRRAGALDRREPSNASTKVA